VERVALREFPRLPSGNVLSFGGEVSTGGVYWDTSGHLGCVRVPSSLAITVTVFPPRVGVAKVTMVMIIFRLITPWWSSGGWWWGIAGARSARYLTKTKYLTHCSSSII